jgi:hypothetical protein
MQPPTRYEAPLRSSVQALPYHDLPIPRPPSRRWPKRTRVATVLADTRDHCPSSRRRERGTKLSLLTRGQNLIWGGCCHLLGRRESLGETKKLRALPVDKAAAEPRIQGPCRVAAGLKKREE